MGLFIFISGPASARLFGVSDEPLPIIPIRFSEIEYPVASSIGRLAHPNSPLTTEAMIGSMRGSFEFWDQAVYPEDTLTNRIRAYAPLWAAQSIFRGMLVLSNPTQIVGTLAAFGVGMAHLRRYATPDAKWKLILSNIVFHIATLTRYAEGRALPESSVVSAAAMLPPLPHHSRLANVFYAGQPTNVSDDLHGRAYIGVKDLTPPPPPPKLLLPFTAEASVGFVALCGLVWWVLCLVYEFDILQLVDEPASTLEQMIRNREVHRIKRFLRRDSLTYTPKMSFGSIWRGFRRRLAWNLSLTLATAASTALSVYFLGLIGLLVLPSVPVLVLGADYRALIYAFVRSRFRFGRRMTRFGMGYTLPSVVNELIKITLVIAMFWRLRDDIPSIIMFVTLIAHSLGATDLLIAHITAVARHLIQPPINVMPTTPDEDTEYRAKSGFHIGLSLGLVAVTIILAGLVFKLSDKSLVTLQAAPALKNVAASIRDLDTLHSKAWPLIVASINAVSQKVFGDKLIPGLHDDFLTLRKRWLNESLQYITLKHPRTRSSAEAIIALQEQGFQLIEQAAELNIGAALVTHQYEVVRKLTDLIPGARTTLIGGVRIGSIPIVVSGDPATGKTHFLQHLAARYFGGRNQSYDSTVDYCTLSTTEEFDTTYTSQKVVGIYDMFQEKNNEQRTRETDFLFKNADTDPHFARKAALQDKGTVPFVNELALATTNMTPPEFLQAASDFVFSPSAFERRLNYFLRLTTNRAHLKTIDTTYRDLEIWSWELNAWHTCSVDALVRSLVLHRSRLEAAHERRRRHVSTEPIRIDGPVVGSVEAIRKANVDSQRATNAVLEAQLGVPLVVEQPKVVSPLVQEPATEYDPKMWKGEDMPVQERRSLNAIPAEERVVHDSMTPLQLDPPIPGLAMPLPNARAVLMYLNNMTPEQLDRYTDGLAAEAALPNIRVFNTKDAVEQRALIAQVILPGLPFTLPDEKAAAFVDRFMATGRTWGDLHCLTTAFRRHGAPVKDVKSLGRVRAAQYFRTLLPNAEIADGDAEKLYNRLPRGKIDNDTIIARYNDAVIEARQVTDSHPKATKYPLLWMVVGTAGALALGGTIFLALRPALSEIYDAKYRDDKKVGSHRPVRLLAHVQRIEQQRRPPAPNPYAGKANTFHTTTVVHNPDPNAMAIAQSVTRGNVCTLWIRESTVQVTMLTGTMGVTAAHFFDRDFDPEDLVVLMRVESGAEFNCLFKELKLSHFGSPSPVPGEEKSFKRHGCIQIQFPNTCPPFRNVLSHVNSLDLRPVFPTARAIVPRIDDNITGFDTVPFTNYAGAPRTTSGDKKYYLSEFICLETNMLHGQCGTPVFIVDPHAKAKLIGILEGDNDRGVTFVVPLPVQQLLEPAAANPAAPGIITDYADDYKSKSLPVGGKDVPLPFNWIRHGHAGKDYTCATYSKDNLVPTVFNKWFCPHHAKPYQCQAMKCSTPLPPRFPPAMAPYRDHTGARRDPIAETINKVAPYSVPAYCPAGMPKAQFCEQVTDDMWRFLRPPPKHGVPPILTLEQSINGVRNVVGELLLKPMELSTALGLPWANQQGFPLQKGDYLHGKHRYFHCSVHGNKARCPEGCGADIICHPSIAKAVAELWEALAHGPVTIINQRSNKNETREPGKLVRTLIVVPTHVNLVGRMLFGGIDSGFVPAADHCVSAVGINPHSLAMHHFLERGVNFGDAGLAGDSVAADWRFPYFVFMLVHRVDRHAMRAYSRLNDFEYDAWCTRSRNFMISMAMSCLSVGGELVEILNQMVTGFLRTLYVNTDGHSLMKIIAWAAYHADRNEPYDQAAFMRSNLYRGVGDDFKWVKRPEETITNHDLRDYVERLFGASLSSPSKGDLPVIYEHVNFEADFLRRTTRLDEFGYYHGVLERASIFKSLSYANSNLMEDTENICRSVLMELYHVGDRAEYARYKLEFENALHAGGLTVSLPDFDAAHRAYLTSTVPEPPQDHNEDEPVALYDVDYTPKSAPGPSDAGTGALVDSTVKEAQPNSVAALPIVPMTQEVYTDSVQWLGDKFVGTSHLRVNDVAGRRINLGNVTWASSDVADATLATYDLLPDVFAGTDLISDTFKGWYFHRARGCIEINLVNPGTSSGCLMVCFQQGRALTTPNCRRAGCENSFVLSNSAPNLRFDVGPIMQNVWDLTSNPTSYLVGQLSLIVMNPLVGSNGSVTADSATIEVFFYFTDLLVAGADGVSILPASAKAQRRRELATLLSKEYTAKSANWRQVNPKDNPDTSGYVRDRPKEKKKAKKAAAPPPDTPPPPSAEAKAREGSVVTTKINDSGPVATIASFALGTVEAIGNTIVKALPFAGEIMKGVGMLAALMDLPLDERAAMPSYLRSPAWQQIAGVSDAQTLGPFAKSHVSHPLLGNPSIADLIQQPALVARYTVTSATAVGTTIGAHYVHPVHIAYRYSTGAGPYTYTYQEFPLWYWSQYFSHVEGSMLIAVQVELPVGTVMTLALSSLPGAAGFPALDQYGDVARLTWTVRQSGMIICELPFQSMQGAVACGPIDTVASYDTAPYDFSCNGGRFVISLKSKLTRSNTTAAATAYVNVWAAGSPNTRFHGYRGRFDPLYIAGPDAKKMQDDYTAKASIGDMLEQKPTPISESSVGTTTSLLRFGPTITHPLQILKQKWYCTTLSANTHATVSSLLPSDFTNILSRFQYWQGSLVFTLMALGDISAARPVVIGLQPSEITTGTAPGTFAAALTDGVVEVWEPRERHRMSFVVPVNNPWMLSDNDWANVYFYTNLNFYTSSWTCTYALFVSAGEDFQLGFARSMPEMSFVSTTPPLIANSRDPRFETSATKAAPPPSGPSTTAASPDLGGVRV